MKELVYNLIHRQQAEIKKILADSTVLRDAAAPLKQSLEHKLIKAIIGPRRSGKSSLVHQVLTNSKYEYAYLNFEDELLPPNLNFDVIDSCLKEVYPKAEIFFFDEIQVFPRWEQLLNRLERGGRKVIISGSNSKLLSSELSSTLTGRHEQFEIFPFSYKEYLQAQPLKLRSWSTFKEYLISGGFPDVVLGRVDPQKYPRELWEAVVSKDIVQRYKVRSIAELKAVLGIVRDSMACTLSNRSIERALLQGPSIATIGKFLTFGQATYLITVLQNFSFKPRERINADKKVYVIDSGFYTSMKVGAQEDLGKLLENFVFNTLLRKGFKPNLDLFYYKTASRREIDFVTLKEGTPLALIQVSWALARQTTLERELAALEEAARDLNVNSATIVTAEERAEYTRGKFKIKALPILDFLEKTDWGD